VWFGRISQAKGLDIAIKIAREMKIDLLIAGKIVNPEAKIFFEKKVRPYLGKKIKFAGELKSEKDKSEFLGEAKAFLYPLQWEEPFGLAMIEAMACGTPVIAFRRGSVPEIVEHGKTGFVVSDSVEALADAVGKIDRIDRKATRQWVENNFSNEHMTDGYEKLYFELCRKTQSK